MTSRDPLLELPDDLPRPVDDGASNHLPGMAIPPVALRATTSEAVDLSMLDGRTVVYCYPRTGAPGETPSPEWEAIPGARGCTAEACDFRDHAGALEQLGARVFGLSTQPTEEQAEAAERLHLPFPLLSDAGLQFASAMRLPTFEFGGRTLLKRLTLVIDDGIVVHRFYPVFPPNAHAAEAIAWLSDNPA